MSLRVDGSEAPRLFGTDGVRGPANREPVTALTFLRIATEGGRILRERYEGKDHPTVIIGRDTRLSGEVLSAAVAAGFASAGLDVLDAGVLPTPGVAFLVRSTGAAGGAVLSASHNPYVDNGLKFLAYGGVKVSTVDERRIEAVVAAPPDDETLAHNDALGRIRSYDDAEELYVEHALDTWGSGPDLTGRKIVIDCANGASSFTSPEALRRLGAEVLVLHDRPNGININLDCGSTHLEGLQKAVLAEKADCGVGHDGDADRVLLVDETGKIVDGDAIMGLCAVDLAERDLLPDRTVVATVMSNLGLEKALEAKDICLLRTPVGDRYVTEEMGRCGASLGGEQSGHVIFAAHSSTGDGLVTALQVLSIWARRGGLFSALFDFVRPYPQVLLNVKVLRKDPIEELPEAVEAIRQAEEAMAGQGRVLVRYSGTESLVRVMVEGREDEAIQVAARRVADVLERILGSEKS